MAVHHGAFGTFALEENQTRGIVAEHRGAQDVQKVAQLGHFQSLAFGTIFWNRNVLQKGVLNLQQKQLKVKRELKPLPQMETNQLLKVIKKRVMIKNLLKKRNKLLKLNTTTH